MDHDADEAHQQARDRRHAQSECAAGSIATSPHCCSIVTFLALAAALFAVAVGYGAVLPLVPALLAVWMPGAPGELVSFHTGLLAASYMLAVVGLAPFWGALSDRRGRRRVLLVGLAGHAVALAGFAWGQSMAQAYALRFAAGAFAGAVLPAVFAAASEIADGPRRASWLARLGAASLLGYLAGPAISGGINALFAAGLQWPIYAGAVVSMLAFAFGCARLPEVAAAAPRTAGFATVPYGVARVAALSTTAMFGLGAFEVGLTVLGTQRLQLGTSLVALLFVECSFVMLAVQAWLALAPATAARHPTMVAGVGFGAMTAGFALLALASSRPSVYAGVALIAAGSGVLLPLLTFFASLPRTLGLGASVGMQTAAANLGQAAGSAAAGWLYGSMTRESFWLYAALMALGAGMAARR